MERNFAGNCHNVGNDPTGSEGGPPVWGAGSDLGMAAEAKELIMDFALSFSELPVPLLPGRSSQRAG